MANIKTLNVVPLENSEGCIIIKGGGVPINNQEKNVEITENGATEVTYDDGFTGLSKVVINTNVASSGGGVSANDVTYYDYDGTILHSFSAEEYASMTSHPDLPTNEGLICQGWNLSFENAKAYVEKYGKVDIGATYITDDGKTRLYIEIPTNSRTDVPLSFSQTVTNGVIVDWGDGSATETFSSTSVSTTHKYASAGDYCITLEVVNGTVSFTSHTMSKTNGYRTMLKKVFIGSKVISIGNNAFPYCYFLSLVTISSSVTSIGALAFARCSSLTTINIPSSVTSIGYDTFKDCSSLAAITIPSSVTSIGNNAFLGCSSLTSINIPKSLKSIGNNAFQSCSNLKSIIIPESVTSIGTYAFYKCSNLKSIIIPKSLKSIGTYAFYECFSLAAITFDASVTSIATYVFSSCNSLAAINIPESVTSIGEDAFSNCTFVRYYDFSNHTAVPTLSSTNAFSPIPSDCQIVVPDALYDEWIAATNWSSYASQIVKASEFVEP